MPHYGVYAALVERAHDDPDGEARIQIALPPALVPERTLAWARLAVPYAGKNRGLVLLPEPGDEVLVAFEGGDLGRPYVLGALWSSYAVPPLAARADNRDKGLLLRSGLRLLFDEAPGQPAITLETKGGQRLTLRDGPEAAVEIRRDGGATLRLEPEGGVTLTTAGGARLSLEPDGGLRIEGVALRLESQSTLTLKGGIIVLDGPVVTPTPSPPSPPPPPAPPAQRRRGVVPIPRESLKKPKKIR